MITAQNYTSKITSVDFKTLPPVMAKMHNQLIEQQNGLNYYGQNPDITRVLDRYLSKLNQMVKATAPKRNEAPVKSKMVSNMAQFKKWLKENVGETIYFFHSKFGEIETRRIKTASSSQASFIKRNGQESWLDFGKAADWIFERDYAKFESEEWGDMQMYYFYQQPPKSFVKELLTKPNIVPVANSRKPEGQSTIVRNAKLHDSAKALYAHFTKQVLSVPNLKALAKHENITSGEFGDAYMRLSIEKQDSYGEMEALLGNSGFTLIVEQNYKQEGDLMSDPRIDYYVVVKEGYGLMYPLNYQQHNLGLYKEYISDSRVNVNGMIDTMKFSKTWFKNLKLQGRNFLSNESTGNRKPKSNASSKGTATSKRTRNNSAVSASKRSTAKPTTTSGAKRKKPSSTGTGQKARTQKSAKKGATAGRRQTAAKAKAATPSKKVQKPIVHRKVKSPELSVITRFLNLPKAIRTHKSIELFHKQIANGLRGYKYVDHKSLMTEIKSMLKKLLDAMDNANTDTVEVSLNDKLKAKCQKVLKGATEKLRVSYLGELPNEPVIYVPEHNNTNTLASGNYVSSRLPTIDSMPIPSGPVKTFNFRGDFGQFLGPVSIEPESSVVAAFTADKGTGKTHALFQAMEDIASSGYSILYGSYEEFVSSSLFVKKRDKYLSVESQKRITAVDQREVPTSDEFFVHANNYDVIIIDSAQELPGGVDIQRLRETFKGKLFIIIYHATTEGKFKGGTSPQHKADIIIVGEKHDDYRDNYLHYGKDGKNRYQAEQGLKYSIFNQKLISHE